MRNKRVNIDIEKYNSEGYLTFENFLRNSDVNEFELNISNLCEAQISKLGLSNLSKDPLIDLFNRGGDYRNKLYESIKALVVFEKLKIRLYDELKDSGLLVKLNFKTPILRSALFISLPNEEFLDNPPHQDIYSYISKKALRFWIPLRKVDEYHGSMKLWPRSHQKGFIPPDDYTNVTYPTFQKKHFKGLTSLSFDNSPGPCVMFNPLIMHSTVSNKSKIVRMSFTVDIIDLADLGDFNDPDTEFSRMMDVAKNRNVKRSASKGYKKL